MKFEILSEGYERRGEETPFGTIPLRSTSNRRDFFLNSAAAELLALPEGVHDFEEEFGQCSPEKKRDLEDGLILLSAFGAAAITEEKPDFGAPYICRVAGEKDYKAIAALINSDTACRLGTIQKSETNMSQDMIRARQFNNQEYNFLCLKEGKPLAVLLVGMPAWESYSDAFRIAGIAVANETDQADIKELAGMLLDYAIAEFQEEFSICRYLSFAEDDPLAEMLKEKGFSETASLKGEAEDGGDVVIYDRRISPC